MRKILLALALALTGCGSYAKDLQMVCDASEHAGVESGDDPAVQAEKISLYVEQHLSSSKGRRFFQSLASAGSSKDVSQIIRAEAARNGITSCPLADKQDSATQGFARDLEMICNAEKLAGVTAADGPAERLQKIALYVSGRVETPQGQRFITEFGKGKRTPAERAELLRQTAHGAGVTSCPLAEH